MTPTARCDEIIRVIDEALAAAVIPSAPTGGLRPLRAGARRGLPASDTAVARR